ncbi:hypothetical protein OE88DRAFT_1666516 [Heliocybe sulcata]|uniref:Uncharacterized protein n=1 Tax=Heliocybe sulcata TaxID=5364 RepID=A0A5C3MQU0_9AGAM|nr:hypothetical protein OE88DRAFT_1666516 [Heliocybe sulcata]
MVKEKPHDLEAQKEHLLYYMRLRGCHWGYIISDKEVVCARRPASGGIVIELSDPIPLTCYR